MDKNDLKWVANEKTILLLLNIFKTIFVLKPIGRRNLGQFSRMQNDASMHREGLKGKPFTYPEMSSYFYLLLAVKCYCESHLPMNEKYPI